MSSTIGRSPCCRFSRSRSHNIRFVAGCVALAVGGPWLTASAKTVEVASGGDIAAAVVEAHSDGNAGAVHLRGEYAVMRRTSGCLVIRENP